MSHRSDVWSGCVAMMDILVGKETHTELHVEVRYYRGCFYLFILSLLIFND